MPSSPLATRILNPCAPRSLNQSHKGPCLFRREIYLPSGVRHAYLQRDILHVDHVPESLEVMVALNRAMARDLLDSADGVVFDRGRERQGPD